VFGRHVVCGPRNGLRTGAHRHLKAAASARALVHGDRDQGAHGDAERHTDVGADGDRDPRSDLNRHAHARAHGHRDACPDRDVYRDSDARAGSDGTPTTEQTEGA
jgi:hypothetical protein